MNKIFLYLVVVLCLVCSLIIIADASTTTTSSTTTTYWSTVDPTPTTSTTTTTNGTTTCIPPCSESTTSTVTTTTTASTAKVEILGGGFSNGLWHPVPQLPAVNRALIFVAFAERSGPITLNSVTYGGRPMTKFMQQSVGTNTQNYIAAFVLNDANIAAATNENFVVSWSAAPSEAEYGHAFFQNVKQSTPIGAKASKAEPTGLPNPITTAALATSNGDMVFSAPGCGNNGTYTLNNGFARWFAYNFASSCGAIGIKSATGVQETPKATFTGALSRQVMIGFVLRFTAN